MTGISFLPRTVQSLVSSMVKSYLPKIFTIFLFLTGGVFNACAELKWSEEKEKVFILARNGDCQEIWNVLWYWSKQGNDEARHYLANAIIYTGLVPPISKMDDSSYKRVSFELLSYGAVFNFLKLQIAFDVPALNNEGIQPDPAMIQCLASSDRRDECINSAIKNNYIRPFDEIVKEIDSLSGNEKAVCRKY